MKVICKCVVIEDEKFMLVQISKDELTEKQREYYPQDFIYGTLPYSYVEENRRFSLGELMEATDPAKAIETRRIVLLSEKIEDEKQRVVYLYNEFTKLNQERA